MKCTKTLFSKDGLKNNISSYILIIFITHFLISILLFLKCGYPILIDDINKTISEKKIYEKRNTKHNNILPQGRRNSRIMMKRSSKKYFNNFPS